MSTASARTFPLDALGRLLLVCETAEAIELWCGGCGAPWEIPLDSYWRVPLCCPRCNHSSRVIRDLGDFENVRS